MVATLSEVPDVVPVAPRSRRLDARWVGAATGVLAAVAVVAAMRGALADDSYITLSFARELAEHHHWGLVPGLSSNTATSPLNVWLLAATYLVIGDHPVVAVGVVLAGALAVLGWCAATLPARHRPLTAVLAVAVLASSPLMTSTVGLETYLGAAVLTALAAAARAQRSALTGALVGLAVLTRPDLAVPAVALTVGLLPRRSWVPALGIGAAVALPWHLFAWYRLGGFVPDTLFLKAGESAWEGYRFADGTGLYWRDFPAATALTVAIVAAGVLAALAARRRVPLVLAAAGASHFAAMSLLGTPPYAWYFAPPFVLCTLAVTVASSSPAGHRWIRSLALVAMVVVAAASAVLVVGRPDQQVGPVVYNWGSSAQYALAGADTARITRGEPILSGIEIGAFAYACRCDIHSEFSDPAMVDRFVTDRAWPAMRTGERAFYRWDAAHRSPSQEPSYRWEVTGHGLHDPAAVPIPGRRWAWPTDTPAHGTGWVVLDRIG